MVEGAVRSKSVRWLTAFAGLAAGCSLLTDLGPLTEGGGNGVLDSGGADSPPSPDGSTTDGSTATDSSSSSDGGPDAPVSESGPDGGCTTIPLTNGSTSVSEPIGPDEPWGGVGGALTAGDGQSAVSATTALDDRSDRIIIRGFGFLVPAAATITDVRVEVTRSGVDHEDERIELVTWNGSGTPTYGTNRSTEQNIPTVSTARTYSGTPASWGMALSPSIVNASSFGFAFAAKYKGVGSGSVFVDGVRISITYCQ